MNITRARLDSPAGPLVLFLKEATLVALDFEDRSAAGESELRKHFGDATFTTQDGPALVTTRLRRYFEGDLKALDEIAVDPQGTPFQKDVWAALRRIPVGRTVSYAEIARAVGRPGAVRAVGTANGRNPIAIVIPCHRVIGTDGHLHGYGGGLDRKEWLLAHEGALARVKDV